MAPYDDFTPDDFIHAIRPAFLTSWPEWSMCLPRKTLLGVTFREPVPGTKQFEVKALPALCFQLAMLFAKKRSTD